MRKVIAVDIGRCLACKSCEIACAVAHSASGRLEEAVVEHPKPQKRVTVEAAGQFAVPMQCRHCEDALASLSVRQGQYTGTKLIVPY